MRTVNPDVFWITFGKARANCSIFSLGVSSATISLSRNFPLTCTAIVTSLNTDILTPILGLFGGADFSNYFIQLTGKETIYATLAEAKEAGVAVLAYGSFITAIINFLITAFVIFCMIKIINTVNDKLTRKPVEEAPAPTTKICPYCKSEISIEATRCPHCTSQLPENE